MSSHGPQGPASGAPLPPELNPRGRRAGRAEIRATLADTPGQALHPTRMQRRRAGSSWGADLGRGVIIGAMVVSAVVSCVIVLGSGYAWYEWKGLNSNIRRVDAIPASSSGGTSSTTDIDGTDQNILVVGNDDRDTATDAELKELGTTRDGGSYNTDTMMILHLAADGKTAQIISMPRDSWVAIPGHGMDKLNAAYPDGVNSSGGDKSVGAQLLVKTVQNLTGLHIDHFIQVDLIGFFRISNAISGVQVNLCNAVKDSYSGINLPAGVSTISGSQALAFVRQRHGLSGGDFDRIKRQQYFLTAAFKKITSAGVLLNPIKLNNLISAVSSSVTMDDPSILTKLAPQFSNLSAGKIATVTIPNNGTGTIDGLSVVLVTPSAVQSYVKALVNPVVTATPTPAPAQSTVDPSTVTVDVLNGSGTTGVASANAAALRTIGFTVGNVGDAATSYTTTTIEYPAGDKAQAATVQAQIPGAKLTESSSVTAVTLILGSDGLAVNGAKTSATPTPAPIATPAPNAAVTGACIN